MMLRAFLSVCVLLAVSQVEGLIRTTGPGAPVTKAAEHGAVVSGITTKPKPANKTEDNITLKGMDLDGSMIQRALYVLIGITIIGVLYFLVRAVRLKKTTTQRKKYGLLSNYDDTVEMAQLESDEEDTTVYEAKSLRRRPGVTPPPPPPQNLQELCENIQDARDGLSQDTFRNAIPRRLANMATRRQTERHYFTRLLRILIPHTCSLVLSIRQTRTPVGHTCHTCDVSRNGPYCQHHASITKDCNGVLPDSHGVTQNCSGSSSVTSAAFVLVDTTNESVCGGTG
ncbi:hypothetical protein NFI96_027782, partial [Prochilodus magdalenae]